MKSLQEFYRDSGTSENVYNYLIEFLEKEGLKKMFDKEDVSAIAEAKEIIDNAWKNMEIMFDKKPKKKKQVNQSR